MIYSYPVPFLFFVDLKRYILRVAIIQTGRFVIMTASVVVGLFLVGESAYAVYEHWPEVKEILRW